MSSQDQVYQQAVELLQKIDQIHLLQGIDKYTKEDRLRFAEQVLELNKTCPGGLEDYCNRSKKLLMDSKNNVNPFQGYEATIPTGQIISFKDLNTVKQYEKVGIEQVQYLCFVLVAGGLGERLGYNGIKLAIPMELITKQCFLDYYFTYIHALQCRCPKGIKIPIAIMTSDDTHELTIKLLEQNNYYCLSKDQVTIMKQQKVPAMINNNAHFVLEKDKLLIETKPHGHGDVHSLLYQTGLVQKWAAQNKQWIAFFQDTNPLCFRAVPSVLGVSKSKNFIINSIATPRKPGEAVGSICKLTGKDKKTLINNVEYNQLSSIISKEPLDKDGFSLFPGNTNCIIFSLKEYNETLSQTKGVVPEFVNPKYSDLEKIKFKSPTRLESMMQDYPKLLSSADRVGFTQVDREFSFTAIKNSITTGLDRQKANLCTETASSFESGFYRTHAQLLRFCGAVVEDKDKDYVFEGLKVNFGPRIILDPHCGCTIEELQNNFKGKIFISSDSTLILKGSIKIQNLHLDGVLKIEGNGLFKDINVKSSEKHKFVPVDIKAPQIPLYIVIRGYDIKLTETENDKEHKIQIEKQ